MFKKSKKTPSAEDMMAEFLSKSENTKDSSNLEKQVKELTAKFEALSSLIQKNCNVSAEEIQTEIEEAKMAMTKEEQTVAKTSIDPVQPAATPCPKCGRVVSAKTGICLYCGVAE